MSNRANRSVASAVLLAALWLVLTAGAAPAQEGSPSPNSPISTPVEAPPGICAPWHKCVAYGAGAMVLLLAGALGIGYLVQSRGFDTVEHRMGTPQGAPVKREGAAKE